MHPNRSGRSPPRPNGALLRAIAAILLVAVPTAAVLGIAGATSPVVGGSSASPYVCPFNTTEDASARDVALAAPTFPLANGDILTVTYELRVTSTTLPTIDLDLYAPSLFAKFPLSNGTTLQSYLAPRTLLLTNSSWSSASVASHSKTMTGPTTFSGSSASMTTELLAFMGTASYQTVTLAFRWDWSVTFASNGTVVTSPWSFVATGGAHPTTFYPAPYVQRVAEGNTTVAIGGNFTVTLSGAISRTAFHSVLEYASTGNVLRNQATLTRAGNATPDLASVTILPFQGSLAPALLLDHLRNVCGALLYSIGLTAVYAPSASVTLLAQPASCGPVTFNGTAYPNGSLVSLRPSSTGVSASVGTCAGMTFQGWGRTAGVWVSPTTSASTTATVSANGTLTAAFA